MYQRDERGVRDSAEDGGGARVPRRGGPGVQDRDLGAGQPHQLHRVQDRQGEQVLHRHRPHPGEGVQENPREEMSHCL